MKIWLLIPGADAAFAYRLNCSEQQDFTITARTDDHDEIVRAVKLCIHGFNDNDVRDHEQDRHSQQQVGLHNPAILTQSAQRAATG
jgi:hypothetical protein